MVRALCFQHDAFPILMTLQVKLASILKAEKLGQLMPQQVSWLVHLKQLANVRPFAILRLKFSLVNFRNIRWCRQDCSHYSQNFYKCRCAVKQACTQSPLWHRKAVARLKYFKYVSPYKRKNKSVPRHCSSNGVVFLLTASNKWCCFLNKLDFLEPWRWKLILKKRMPM